MKTILTMNTFFLNFLGNIFVYVCVYPYTIFFLPSPLPPVYYIVFKFRISLQITRYQSEIVTVERGLSNTQ